MSVFLRLSRPFACGATRGFRAAAAAQEAKLYDMPAMSPTMESGAIVEWKVKEGQSFNSGDTLVDIETDKATISVDAIDDGIMAKILLQNGTKDIKVGTPIAIVAEEGDDLSKLPEVPSESSKPAEKTEQPQEAAVAAPTPAPAPTSAPSAPATTSASKAASASQVFFPSVELLLHQNHISREDAIAKIPATGPHGRILKGDVLAYLGKISPSTNDTIAAYLEKTSHMDLSNIKLREKSVSKETPSGKSTKSAAKEPVTLSETYPIDLEIPSYQLSSFKAGIQDLLEEAEYFAYSAEITKPSDLNDPLFEDLISPARNASRFSIEYKLNIDEEVNEVESLDLKLVLNESCFDARERATVFVTSFKQLLTDALTPKDASK